MATSIAVNLDLTLKTIYKFDYGITTNSRTALDSLTKTIGDTMGNGELVDEAEIHWHDLATLDNTTRSLDLYSALLGPDGNAISFKTVKCLLVHNKNTTAGEYIEVGGDANGVPLFSAATGVHVVHPNSFLLIWNPSAAGYTVTAGSGDIILLDTTGSGAAVIYEIIIIGTRVDSSASSSPSTSESTSPSTSPSTSESTSPSTSESSSPSASPSASPSESPSSSPS